MLDGKVHLPRVLPARYVPPSGFGYPLDGFLPFSSGPVLFRTGSAPGIHPSEPSPRRGQANRLRSAGPTYRWPQTQSPEGDARTHGVGFWALIPRPSPWRDQALLTPDPLDAPLGFAPSRVRTHQPGPGFRPDSSCTLGWCTGIAPHTACVLEYRSACAWLPRREPSKADAGKSPRLRTTLEKERPSSGFCAGALPGI